MLKLKNDTFVLSMCKSHKPVATTRSGDTVIFETLDCFSNKLVTTNHKLSDVAWSDINPATGPLFIEDAIKGDTLKVEIIDIQIAEQGVICSAPGFGVFGHILEKETTKIIPIKDGKALFNENLQFPINPMIGVIGTAPETEDIPTGSPGFHGANMDCNKITKGSTLYLPVFNDGALLSMGDVHAIMGDGEVVVCGVEIAAEITVRVSVIKNCFLPLPFLINEEKAMTLYSASTLDEAAKGATLNMQEFVTTALGMSIDESAMLLSISADLSICQMVDPLMTVRMELPRWILDQYGYQFN